jgi:hypothetical protein
LKWAIFAPSRGGATGAFIPAFTKI